MCVKSTEPRFCIWQRCFNVPRFTTNLSPRGSKELLKCIYAQHPRNYIFCTLIYFENFFRFVVVFVEAVNSLG